MSLRGRVKNTYEWFKHRENELRNSANANGGRLKWHDGWRYEYYKQPYLLLESDDVIIERFNDVLSNGLDITVEGKIAPTPMMANNARFARLFTEIIEETNWRGILTRHSGNSATEQLHSYFKDGTPLGVKMFRDKSEVPGQWLLKFSRREFVADMYAHGRFRISPASYYAKGSHIRAVKDLETARNYKLKAINEVIKGKDEINFNGKKIPITGGVVRLEFKMDDYYLFSTCKEINRRMPTDFDADAVLVIKNRSDFIRRLRDSLLQALPAWEFIEGEVYYFDPYNDIPSNANQEFWKHISFAYQKEHRCVLRPRVRQPGNRELKPFFIELGSLDDISEMITA